MSDDKPMTDEEREQLREEHRIDQKPYGNPEDKPDGERPEGSTKGASMPTGTSPDIKNDEVESQERVAVARAEGDPAAETESGSPSKIADSESLEALE